MKLSEEIERGISYDRCMSVVPRIKELESEIERLKQENNIIKQCNTSYKFNEPANVLELGVFKKKNKLD